jgi:hypothetical protein
MRRRNGFGSKWLKMNSIAEMHGWTGGMIGSVEKRKALAGNLEAGVRTCFYWKCFYSTTQQSFLKRGTQLWIRFKAQVVPMEDVAGGIQGLPIVFVNVFGVRNADDSWMLIDAGLPFSEHMIRKWAEKRFGNGPRAIVLTHGHFDQVSAAGALAQHWDVPIYAHPLEHPYLTGQREYEAPNVSAGGGMMSPLLPRGPIDLQSRLRPLTKGLTGRLG